MSSPRRGDWRATIQRAIFPALVLVLSAYFVRTAPEISGDGRLAFVYAFVDHHSLAVDPYVAESPAIEEDLAFYEGHDYMAKPPLPSLLAMIPYALLRLVFPAAHMDSFWWKWLLTVLVSGGALVLTASLVEQLAAEARLPRSRLAALACVIATPLAVYSTLFMATSVGAALVAGLALAAVRRRHLAVGLLSGAMLSTETVVVASAAVPLVLLGIEALRARSAWRVASITGGFLLGALPLVVYQTAAFGSPLAGIYVYLSDAQQRAAFAHIHVGFPAFDAMVALLVSPRNGLFVVAPVAIAGSALLARLWREHVSERRVIGITGGMAVVTVVAFAALPHDLIFWPLRAEYGPRLLIPILPLLCWPLASLSARALAPLTFLCAIPQIVAVAVHQPMLNPGATFQVGEVFRRLVGDIPTPSLVGLLLPSVVPERTWTAQLAFVIVALAVLARIAIASLRTPRST
ncbi:MAG TPA: hypothetical protein VFC31_15190 [Candidatus Limnocylindria bacterium]|nr:hypothetical protein [Candidatus Limnocylindria bacterium]